MAPTFYTDDIVAKVNNGNHLGVVERTYNDITTHEPHPERTQPAPIKRDTDIPYEQWNRFRRDGIPPRGTVFVRWETVNNASLIRESKLQLLDRSLLIGDIVRRSEQDATSGVVINTFTKCRLQGVHDVRYRDNHVIKGLVPPGNLEPGFEAAPAPKPPVLVDIPAEELMAASRTADGASAEEDLVIYKDWIGRVLAVTEKIALLLSDGCVVEIDDERASQADGQLDVFEVGDVAMTKKGNLRTGKWIFGQYNANTPPVGTVVHTRPVLVEVQWLQRRIGAGVSDREPPSTLERDELESEAFQVYDRTRRPAAFHADVATSTISNSEIDIQLGSRVRFRDLAGACVKYDGSPSSQQHQENNKLVRIPRQDTRGYDLNVFDVVRFETDVMVQWQDLSITREKSVDLVPDSSIDDEHAAWPGEIAHTLDVGPVEGVERIEQPGRVGVVQTVDSEERMAKVRWADDAVVQYTTAEEDGEGAPRTLLTGAVGVARGEEVEVSLYDVEAPGAMNVRRGDIVLIARKTWTGTESAPARGGGEWLGEIVDTCLDGTLIVRLGAAETVMDVVVKREDVVVAIRSDGTDDVDGWGGLEEEEDAFGMPERDAEQLEALFGDPYGVRNEWDYGMEVGDEVWDGSERDDSDDDDDEDEEERAIYEDENGQPMDLDEYENEDWESDDEDDHDETMQDADKHQQTPPTSTSPTPSNPTQQTTDPTSQPTTEDDDEPPPQYLILSGPPPSTHHFAQTPSPSSTNPTHLKRTTKEHTILRKPSVLPNGIYIRTWETRLDLLRVLILGPTGTPYTHAPIQIDFHLPPTFPTSPPQAFFHSWPTPSTLHGSGGVGRINPNLYEDGTICLSLLGTWESGKTERWNPATSTLLQVVVSLLGLVLVREPYFNEAGYEGLQGQEGSRRASGLYSERVFLRTRGFVVGALERVGKEKKEEVLGAEGSGVEGLEDVVRWVYWDSRGPGLLGEVVGDLEGVLRRSEQRSGEEVGREEEDGLTVVSKGVCIPLRRALERLRELM
ncbi:hypothetical protein D0860_08214 [Hortaea werneckii]|uniref:UBC core domain-containing protein n=1 Tax=Hortaea werneckii TaxID=91943 RepID=A0A3M7GFS8_HORWE|nr:hypothetical protein D0860_08214 [Hortaea werneckii]